MNGENVNLRNVTRSRPEILRSPSKQSAAASDDYHSVSDYASSSSDDRTTAVRWTTPPSQGQAHTQSQSRSPDVQPVDVNHSSPTQPGRSTRRDRPASAIAEVDEGGPSSLPHTTTTRTRSRIPTESDVSPPTPGVDDTPYIRYAIDQITRNDVDDPRIRRPDTASTGPVQRVVPPEIYDPQPPRREREKEKQPERDDTVNPAPLSIAPSQSLIPVDPPTNSPRYPPLTFRPLILRLPGLALLALLCSLMLAGLIFSAVHSNQNDGLWDYTDADGGRYFIFRFLPQILASIIVLYILAVWTAMMRLVPFVGLASRSVKQQSSAMLLPLRPRSFLLPPMLSYFRAGQPVIGICLAIFWLSFFTIPLHSSLFHVRLFGLNEQAQWRWVTVEAIAWTLVVIYTLLLLSTLLLAIYLFRRRTGLKWDPVSLADIIVLLQRSNTLDQFYASETFTSKHESRQRLSSGSSRLGYWRRAYESGDDNEVFYTIGEEGAPTRRYSLQQGKLKQQEEIADPEKITRRREKDIDIESQLQTQQRRVSTGKLLARVRSPMVRYRYIPWFLSDSGVVAWIVIGFVLLLAFLITSFLRGAIKRGFLPLLDATPSNRGFSRAAFLYSFLPSLLALLLFSTWQSIDLEFRSLQAFAEMSHPEGGLPEKTLLLDYQSCQWPLETTIKALFHGHWRVAWISFIGLASIALPILGGGLFFTIWFPEERETRMVPRWPAFVVLTVFLITYCCSLLFVWPTRKRYLPHDSRSLGEVISFLYRSSLVDVSRRNLGGGGVARDGGRVEGVGQEDEEKGVFKDPMTKTDLVTRLLSVRSHATTTTPGHGHGHGTAKEGERGDEGRGRRKIIFGVYHGSDGREHLGIDWVCEVRNCSCLR
ncbi:MAG: ion channel activity [Watsoniomyces obsoletus]|nr:MAG: ion channel activity [Watsoniomyces obsoletus]